MLMVQFHRVYSRALLGALMACLVACGSKLDDSEQATTTKDVQPILAEVLLTNPSAQDRLNQAVRLEMTQLGITPDTDTASLGFLLNGQVVSHQFIDSDSNGSDDQALLIFDMKGGQSYRLELRSNVPAAASVKRTHAEIGVKTGGGWSGKKYEGGVFQNVQSITPPPQYTDHSEFLRYEGPGIESDKIGYRVYLDWRNGFDIFAKQTYGLHLAGVGLDGYQSYHEPAEWGMDILKVGKSVGIGGFGAWRQGAITPLAKVDKRTVRIVEDGELYSAFSIDYDNWKLGEQSVDVRATLSMQAGSRLSRVNISTSPQLTKLAVGMPKHPETKLLHGSLDITGEAWSYIATLGPQALDGQRLSMFLLFKRKNFVQLREDSHNHALILKVRGGELEYYFGAQWEGEPSADLSAAAVTAMLQAQANRLTYKPRVKIVNRDTRSVRECMTGSISALVWSKKLADSEIKRHGNELAYGQYDTMRQRPANWEYTMGLMTQAVYQLGKASGESRYLDWAQGIVDSYVTDKGELHTYNEAKYNIDSINSGKILLQLYRDTGEQKYRLAADRLRQQLHHHPRQDAGAFWHKKRYPYQLWLDGVYMGMPFLAEYSQLFENGASLEEVMQEFRTVRQYLRDAKTGLYFHAWDEKRQQHWADRHTGLSRYFWARGMGWLAMALVDTLDFIPAENTLMREELSAMVRELADALLSYRDANGVWHQIVDKQGAVGNYPESSSSAMFTYMMLKGVVNGALPHSYSEPALASFNALVNEFLLLDANGSLHVTQACQVGGLGFGRDGSYDYYISEPVINNDPKALGPFIMLGSLVEQVKAL